jgi:hypothetical protein
MAKSADVQWIPSGGVLAVAIAAALVAAILVNVYIGYARAKYEDGSVWYFQIKKDVAKNDIITDASLSQVQIPKLLLSSFKRAVADDPEGRTLILNRKAPRQLRVGEFLWYGDFADNADGGPLIPAGYELVSIPISQDQSFGTQLQPGGYVTIRGEFDISPDPKKPLWDIKDVMAQVQVRSIDGSTEPVTGKRNYNNIQILVTSFQAKQFATIGDFLRNKRFVLSVVGQPDVNAKKPDVDKDLWDFIQKKQRSTPAATPVGPPSSSTLLPPAPAPTPEATP